MNGIVRNRFIDSHSDNRKSKNNLKSVFFIAIGILFAICGAAAQAQQQSKIRKIGWLGTRPASGSDRGKEALRRELHPLGWVEGKNIAFEHRYTGGKLERLPVLADELVQLKVDVILTSTSPATRAAKSATMTIPIVFLTTGDPVVGGTVESLARPGGNVTGFTMIAPVIAGKRLELLKETVPKLTHVAVLWASRQSEQSWKESELAGRQLGLQIHSMEVSSEKQFDAAFNEAIKAGSGALAVTPNPVVNSNRKLITELAAKNRLPAIYPDGRWADADGLMSYGADLSEPYKRVASMIDKILKGTRPNDIPVEQPTKFELMINLKAAKQIGLIIPPNVLARASKVIR